MAQSKITESEKNRQENCILEWCLTSRANLFTSPKQLPKLGTSDHYTISIVPSMCAPIKNTDSVIWRRDLRPSRMREFGSWITQQSWQSVFDQSLIHDKYTDLIITAIDIYLPMMKIKQASADKAWITVKLKSMIARRQAALHRLGKESEVFKHCRNIVQYECSIAKKCCYTNKVAALKSTNIKRWWSEINSLQGGRVSSPWH